VLAKSIDCRRERFIRHPDGKPARPFFRMPRQLALFCFPVRGLKFTPEHITAALIALR
jgi:hypothetical protein